MADNSSRGRDWDKLRLQVLERDGYTCVYCGGEATEADHITAKANGGKDVLSNLVASCKRDNASKGARINVRTNWYNTRWLTSL